MPKVIRKSKRDGLMFGSDPEFFAVQKNEEGQLTVVPPVVFRMDKKVDFKENRTHPIFFERDGSYIHEDGAAFEMGTPPQKSWFSLWTTIYEARREFEKQWLSQHGDICLPHLYSLPSVAYDVDKYADRGPEFQMCIVFGCDPDQDAYNTKQRARIIDARTHPWRYAGGHIHVSGLKQITENPLIAIRSMVITAGLAATAYSDVPELDKERVFLYGKPGKFRVQKYKDGTSGVEYRTPSTRWTYNFHLAKKIFEWTEIGMYNLLEEGLFASIAKKIETDAVNAIQNFDQTAAKNILSFIETKV